MSTIIYTGYVYIWYDTKAKLFYVGGHKGRVNDRYICSNMPMKRAYLKRAYLKRPKTFKFKVLEYTQGDAKCLRLAEQKWLNLIKETELMNSLNVKNKTCKYYNVKKNSVGGNGSANKGNNNIGGWNKGYSNYEVILRKERKICFYPLDKPPVKNNIVNYNISNKKCFTCDENFESKRINHNFCCEKCRNKFYQTKYKRKK